MVKTAINEYTNDAITSKISSVISPDEESPNKLKEPILSVEEIQTMDYIKNMFSTNLNIVYKKTSRYSYMQIGELSNKWICRVFFQKNRNMLSLRKFEDTDYECEYYFDDLEQLDGIEELIKDTFEKCALLMR